MKTIQQAVKRSDLPIRILQFGEGNFLRAFVDQMVDEANQKTFFNGSIVIVKPRAGGDLSLLRNRILFSLYIAEEKNPESWYSCLRQYPV